MFVWGICMMVFTRIINIKKGYGMVFMCIVSFKIIFSLKSDYVYVCGMG